MTNVWKKTPVAFLLIFFAMVFCNTEMRAQDLTPALLDQGLKLYAAKDYSGAADYLGQVVDMVPEHDQARYYLVFSLAMSGNREKALEHARKLVARKPSEKQYSAIVDQLQSEIAREKQKIAAQNPVGRIAKDVVVGGYQSRDVAREPVISTQTRDIAPPKEKTPLDFAIEKIDEENYASATELLNKIIAVEPANAKAWHHLGVIFFNTGKYAGAVEKFEKALAADSKSFQSRFLIGDCYRAMEDYAKAEEQFRKAVEIKEDVFAMLNLADAMVKQGRLGDAEAVYEKVAKKDPNISDAIIGLAQIKLYKGFFEDAAEMINGVIVAGGGNPEANYTRAQILLENKLFEEAAEEAKKALEAAPGNLKYRAINALSLVRSFNVPKGLEEAAGILEDFPESSESRLVLAEGLIMSGATGDAEEHLLAVEKRVKHPQVCFLRATAALKNNNIDAAKEFFREYVERSAGQPKAAFEYATFLETNGQNADAVQAYHAIAEQFPETAYAAKAKEAVERLETDKTAVPPSAPQGDKKDLRPGKVKF